MGGHGPPSPETMSDRRWLPGQEPSTVPKAPTVATPTGHVLAGADSAVAAGADPAEGRA